MKSTMYKALIICAILLLPIVAWASEQIPAHPKALVDGEWVMEHASEKNVVVLDASDRKDDTYVKKTVKDAFYLPYRELRQPSGMMKGVTFGMERQTFDESPLEEIFRQAGINEEATVVVVAQYRVDDAMLVFWSLKWLGHEDVRILPVNYLEALPEKALTTERHCVSEVDRGGNFEARPDWSWYATREDVVRAMHSPATELWDVRSKPYFEGDKTKTIRGGTMATAKNWPFKKAWTDDSMAELDWEAVVSNLEERFARENRDRDATMVISICNSGHTAAAGFLAWQCGFDWTLCDSSWNMLAYDGSLPVKNIQFYVKP